MSTTEIADPLALEEPLVGILTDAARDVNNHIMIAIFPVDPRRAMALLQQIQNSLLEALQSIDPRAGKSKGLGLRGAYGGGYTELDTLTPMFDQLTAVLNKQVEAQSAKASKVDPEDEFRALEVALDLAERTGDADLVVDLRAAVSARGRALIESLNPLRIARRRDDEREAPNPTGPVVDLPTMVPVITMPPSIDTSELPPTPIAIDSIPPTEPPRLPSETW